MQHIQPPPPTPIRATQHSSSTSKQFPPIPIGRFCNHPRGDSSPYACNAHYGCAITVPPHFKAHHRSLLPPLRGQSYPLRLSIWHSRLGKSKSNDSSRGRTTRTPLSMVTLWSSQLVRPRFYPTRISSLQRSMLDMPFVG
jgi:hypothetical protein